MMRDVLVYISGPMTAKDGYTIEENCAAGIKAYLALLARGIPAFCPHLSGLSPSCWAGLTHAQWLAYDQAILDRCTHVLLLRRWETSAGAQVEIAYAIERGIQCFYAVDDLVATLDRAKAS